ncbi:MAG: hypothetical protein M1820_010257 [Bogoriella megaspora]|nr:MAG: hypothetical protein M1820_010257 [Bogoriella megaspora]
MSAPTTVDTGAVAGTWDLRKVSLQPATESMIIEDQPTESVIGNDGRTLVNAKDFAPGGIYRFVVKLQLRYEKQKDSDPWAMGTGWLIAPQLVVTAGHCVYDWSHGLGRCISVKAYIGYNGRDSVTTGLAQQRRGLKIVTTGGWLQSAANRPNDVAFIQLDAPFKDAKYIRWTPTPLTGTEEIGVVGYPGDKTLGNKEGGERGASMYEQFKQVKWNLDTSKEHMLDYNIDTFGGQSGSPVLVRHRIGSKYELHSIGAHVYGIHGEVMVNSCSTINGRYGNQYAQYIAAMYNGTESSRTDKGISFVPLSKLNAEKDLSQEDFFDGVLSGLGKAASLVGPILQTSSSFLGPIGGPIAALAGTALSVAGRVAAESDTGEIQTGDDLTQRGILAESALQTVLEMSQSKPSSRKPCKNPSSTMRSYTTTRR